MVLDGFSASNYHSSLLSGPVSGGRRMRKTGKKCANSKKDMKKLRTHTKKVHKAYKKFLKMVNKLPIKKRRLRGGSGEDSKDGDDDKYKPEGEGEVASM